MFEQSERFIKSDTNPNPELLIDYAQERGSDYQYHDYLVKIRKIGRQAISGMDIPSREILGYEFRFKLTNGFPIITERDLTRGTTPEIISSYESRPELRPLSGPLKQAIGETIAFNNGARTQNELESYGCTHFWKPWTIGSEAKRKAEKRGLPVGDLGDGSYGAIFHDFPYEGGTFDQYKNLVSQIRSRPELRTHLITPYFPPYITRSPEYIQKTLIVPCHGMEHYFVNTDNKTISMIHIQRSADSPVGLPFNFAGHAANLMMVGQVTGYKPDEYIHYVCDGHIYEPQIECVDELVKRMPYPFPKLYIDPTVKNIEDFRVEHFKIQELYAHPPMKMGEIAI